MRTKTFCGLALLLTCAFSAVGVTSVQAGEINAQEARLVSEASGTFSYEGKTYRASAQYVDELRSYLCEDDVDLTAEDVDSLIADMYANVGAGVQDGYLEECQETIDIADGTTEANGAADVPSDEASKADASDTKAEEPSYIVEETPEQTQIVDAEGSIIFSAAPMIKNVGYHTQNVRALSVIGILMLTAILGGTTLVIRHEKA